MIDIKAEVVSAERRIRPYIRNTLLDYSFHLSRLADCHAFLKLENLQHTGSFKARGAINKILTLNPLQREAGVVAASTGNHGLAVAHGASKLGIRGVVFLPENASPQKVQILSNYKVEIKYYGNDCADTEKFARSEAQRHGRTYISPYNDPKVIGGQGTIALELLKQLEAVDCIFVSVGGGGLIAGIGGYIKQTKKNVEIIGCLAQNSPTMYESIRAGRIVDWAMSPTLSDGTAGGIETDSITFEPCLRYVDDWILVDEDQIREGIKLIFEQHRYVIEGAAGVVVASFLKMRKKLKGKNVILLICGANIEFGTFKEIVF
jgi:threonine dehydratase